MQASLPPEHQSISERLGWLAARQPELPAILSPGRPPLTFAGLTELLDSVASSVRLRGLTAQSRIAVVAGAWGPEAAVAELAVAAAATAVPMNPAATANEIGDLMQRARVNAVVIAEGIDTAAREAADQLGIPVLTLHATLDGPAGTFRLSAGDPNAAVATETVRSSGKDSALIVTTTGTTGRPKLMARTHEELLGALASLHGVLDLTTADRVMALVPLHSLAAFYMVLGHVMSGGSAVFPSAFDPTNLLTWMKELHVTWYFGNQVVQEGVLSAASRYPAPRSDLKLRLIVNGGTPLRPATARALETTLGAEVRPLYAMNEAWHITVVPAGMAGKRPASVGITSRLEMRVADEDVRTVAAGQVGEVVIRGPGIIDRYLDDPEATSVAFRGGWFHTGDIGFLDDDGYLTLTGRLKEQINRGGEKVSPMEVEEALLSHPAVVDAAAFAIPHRTLGEDVAAAVVLDGNGVSEADLRDFALDHLAPHKVPRRLVFVESIPRQMGKVQRVGMADRLGLGPGGVSGQHSSPPREGTEGCLAEIWQRLLETKAPVGRDADFFDLGGDSLLAVEMLLEVEKALSVRVPHSELLKSARLVDLAAAIDHQPDTPPISPLVTIQEGAGLPPFFWVPGGGGSVIGVAGLAFHLGSEQPFYTFQPRGIDGKQAPLTDVEEIAANYLEPMRKVQPEGPYQLGGVSFGGIVAYEMARQLHASGESVCFLAMVDSHYPDTYTALRSTRQRAQYFIHASPAQKADSLRRFVDLQQRRAARLVKEKLLRVSPRPENEVVPTVIRASYIALRHYRPRPHSGRLTYFLAETPKEPGSMKRWAQVATGGFEVHEVPGAHADCMREPLLGVFAAQLRQCLAGTNTEAELVGAS